LKDPQRWGSFIAF